MSKYEVIKGQAVIPEDTMFLEDFAFKDNYHLENVVLPRRTGRIGEYAFANCLNLRKVELSDLTFVLAEGLLCTRRWKKYTFR